MKIVIICVKDDGTFSVYSGEKDEAAIAAAEGQGAQIVQSADEALAMAKEMLGGGETGAMSPEQMLAEPMPAGEAMQAGFKKARGPAAGY